MAAACAPAPPGSSQAGSSSAPPPTREPLPTQGPLPTAASTAVAAAPPTAATPKQGGSVVSASTSDAVTFHPYLRTDTASGGYQGLVYAGDLLSYDPQTLEKRPEAAKAWLISDDKLTYTFTLRDDLVWSDGHPLTSADYKWTYEQAIKPDNKYPYVSNLKPIASYDAPIRRRSWSSSGTRSSSGWRRPTPSRRSQSTSGSPSTGATLRRIRRFWHQPSARGRTCSRSGKKTIGRVFSGE